MHQVVDRLFQTVDADAPMVDGAPSTVDTGPFLVDRQAPGRLWPLPAHPLQKPAGTERISGALGKAVAEYEALQRAGGVSRWIKSAMIEKVKARVRAPDRVTGPGDGTG